MTIQGIPATEHFSKSRIWRHRSKVYLFTPSYLGETHGLCPKSSLVLGICFRSPGSQGPCWHALSPCGFSSLFLSLQEFGSELSGFIFPAIGWNARIFRSGGTLPQYCSWGLFRTLTPHPKHCHPTLSLFHRCKEEARRACRAGKKQLVSFLFPLPLWTRALGWQRQVPQQFRGGGQAPQLILQIRRPGMVLASGNRCPV